MYGPLLHAVPFFGALEPHAGAVLNGGSYSRTVSPWVGPQQPPRSASASVLSEFGQNTGLIAKLAALLELQVYMPNDVIYQSGDLTDCLYIVLTGEVYVSPARTTRASTAVTASATVTRRTGVLRSGTTASAAAVKHSGPTDIEPESKTARHRARMQHKKLRFAPMPEESTLSPEELALVQLRALDSEYRQQRKAERDAEKRKARRKRERQFAPPAGALGVARNGVFGDVSFFLGLSRDGTAVCGPTAPCQVLRLKAADCAQVLRWYPHLRGQLCDLYLDYARRLRLPLHYDRARHMMDAVWKARLQ